MTSAATIQTIGFLVLAAALEAGGDAVVRLALQNHAGVTAMRIGVFGLGAALLLAYGAFLNLAPLEFRDVVGLYVATLFIVWQVVNYAFFRTLPTLPVVAGGTLVVIGGALVSFWKP